MMDKYIPFLQTTKDPAHRGTYSIPVRACLLRGLPFTGQLSDRSSVGGGLLGRERFLLNMVGQHWPYMGGVMALAIFVYWKFMHAGRRNKDIQNKVVLITGASSGLGKACAKVFYGAGAHVILCARETGELEVVKRELMVAKRAGASDPALVTFDLMDESSIVTQVQQAVDIFGHIDIVINNGGISYRGEISDTSMEVDRRLMEVNYFGQVAVTKTLLPHLMQRGSGHIVFVSSVQGKLSIPFRSAYSASKHAVQAFADCLRSELHQHGVKVTVICPGYIATNLSLNAVTGDGSTHGAMDKTTASGMTPEFVAKRIMEAVSYDQSEVLLAASMHKLAIYLRNIVPGAFFRIMASRALKQRKEQ